MQSVEVSTWLAASGEGHDLLARLGEHRPAYGAALREVEEAIWGQQVVAVGLLELCRLRIAQLLGADEVASTGARTGALDPSLVRHLRQWPTSPEFTDVERVCLGYAEQLLMDAQAVTDEQASQVVDALGEGGFLVLTYACGIFETTLRAQLVLTGRTLP